MDIDKGRKLSYQVSQSNCPHVWCVIGRVSEDHNGIISYRSKYICQECGMSAFGLIFSSIGYIRADKGGKSFYLL